MVEDDLDGTAPTRRLRLSVARAGLRERVRQVRRAGKAAHRRLITAGRRTTLSLRGSIVACWAVAVTTAAAGALTWVAIGAAAVSIVLASSFCFNAAIQPSVPIAVLSLAGIAPLAYLTTSNLRSAIRKSKRLWSAPGRG